MGEDTPKDPCETCRYHGFENEFCGTCCSQTDHYASDKSVELAKLREEVKRLQAELAALRSRLAAAEAEVARQTELRLKIHSQKNEEIGELRTKCDRMREALKGAADYLASAADAFRNGCKQLPTEVIDAYWRKVDELRALAPAPAASSGKQAEATR